MAIQSNGQPKTGRYQRQTGATIVGEFDNLVDQLRDLLDTFQGRVTRYTGQMEIVADIATHIANVQELDRLLPDIADEIKDGFDLHHVNIYLIDDERKNLVLRAASGKVGQEMVQQGYSVSLLDNRNQAAMTASIGEPIITHDVNDSPDFDFHDLIPGTHSKMTIPMISQEALIGVLAVQGAEVDRFDQMDRQIKTTLGEQLAAVIGNAARLREVQNAQQDLDRSQNLLQSVLNNIPIGVFAKDTQGRYLFANNLFLQDANLPSPEAIVGKTDYELPWADTEADAYTADDREVMNSDAPKLNIEEPQTHADGNVIWLSTSKVPMRNTHGEVTGVLAMYQDITERKQAEDAQQQAAAELAESQNLLQSVLDNVPGSVFAKDTDGRYTFVNRAFLNLVGISSPEDVIGKTDYEMPWAETEADAFVADDRSIIESGEGRYGYEEPLTQGGMTKWVSTTKVPLLDENGRATGLLALNEDITERKRAADRENLAYEIGQQLNTLQDPRELLQFAVDLLANTLNFYHAHIYTYNESQNALRVAAGLGTAGEVMVRERHTISYEAPRSLVASAARSLEAVVVQDVGAEGGHLPNPLIPRTQSEAAIPLYVGSTLLGVLDVQSDQANSFDDEEVRLLTVVASQLSVALSNARQFEEVERRLQDIAIINEAARIIVDADDQTSMMEDVLALIASAIGATSAVFTEFNYIRSDWSTFATYNVSEDTTPNVRRPAEDYPHGVEALQTNSVVVVEDVTEYEGFPEYIIEQYDVRAVAAMPLVGRGESLGVAFFNYVHDAHAFDESPVSLLEGISRQIATGVEAKRAEESNRRRLVEIQVANAAARIVTEAPDVKTMLSEILELLAEGLGADNAALVNYVQDENRWEGIVGYGMPAGIIENVNDPYESFPHAVDALETNEPVAVDNAYEYEKFPMDYVESIGIKSVLAVPIANRRDKIGVAFFNFNNDFHAFRDDEIRLAKTVAQQIVSGIAQKQSEETNARLRRLSDSSNDFMGTADLETLAITYINGAGLNLIGYTEEDIYGKPIPMLHTEAAFKKVSEEGVPVVMSGEAWRSESELVAKDGTVIPVEQTMFVVTDSDGNPISLGTTMTDIRSRKQAESNMRRFAMLTDNSTDFIGYADLHTQQALYVNEAGARLLGYAPEETIGIPLTDLATPETTELFQTAIPEVMATGNWFGQTTLQHKDGTAIPVEQQIYLLTDDDGKPFALATTARDIRDRIEQEEIVRQRAAQLETVSEVATQAANTLDLDDMLQDVVDLAKKQFDLYHAHIYLLDGSELILAAGADENGRRMKATGHHISINNQNSIVATAARSGAPVRSNDVTSNIAFLPNPLLPKTRSELAVPLIYNREVIGVFDIQDDKPNRFRAEDETIQEILAGQIAVAVQNSRTFAKEQERARELETVAQVSTASSTILDTDVLLKQVVELTKEAFDLYHAHIYLLNPEGDRLFVAAGSGSAGDLMQANNHNIAMQHETSIVAEAARTRRGVRVDDVVEGALSLPNPLLPETRAEMALPMIVGDKLLGVLDVQSVQPGRFTDDDLRIKSTLASQVAVAVENARAFERNQSILDRLAENEEQLRQFVEFSPSAVAMFNTDLEYLVASKRWYTDYGFDPKDSMIGKYHYDVFPETPEHWRRILDDVMSTGEPQRNESEEFVREDGRSQWVRWEVNPWFTPFGEVGGLILSTEDITEVLQQQRERERLLQEQAESERRNAERLREIDRLKSQFLASMSHELRTPLNSIIGYSEVLLDGGDGELSEDAEEDIEIIYTSGKHLLAIINDILDLAKIEANQMKLHKEPTDVVKILRDVIKTNEVLIGQKPIELKLDSEVDELIVPIDELRIRQVVLNLFSNAVKFTEQGSVTLELSMFDNQTARIAVTDTGIGISEEGLKIVFDQFRQVDGSSTRKAGGTGLGLTITRYLIQMHGGEIYVESEEDKGSSFWFTLPLVATESEIQPQLPAVE